MDFNEYQKKAWETAIYPRKGENLSYPALGLGGEVGEVIEKIKKIIRNDNQDVSEEKKQELIKEMGDLLWYLAAVATELKVDLNDVVENNISKIKNRQEKGTIHGPGDNR